MLLWGYRDTSKCARCGFEIEDFPHVVDCQHFSSKSRWSKSLRGFDVWMEENNTLPRLRKSLIQQLRRWHSGETLVGIPPILEQAFLEQEQIGWYNFLFGYVSTEWQRLQQEHYLYLGLRNTGKRWVTSLIEKLWQVAWDQWDDRNKTLHQKNKILEYHDVSDLDEELRTEYFKGIPPAALGKIANTSKNDRSITFSAYQPSRNDYGLVLLKQFEARFLLHHYGTSTRNDEYYDCGSSRCRTRTNCLNTNCHMTPTRNLTHLTVVPTCVPHRMQDQ